MDEVKEFAVIEEVDGCHIAEKWEPHWKENQGSGIYHVIEYSAYQALLEKNKKLVEAVKDLIGMHERIYGNNYEGATGYNGALKNLIEAIK